MTDRVSKEELKNLAVKLEKTLEENRRLQDKIDMLETGIYDLIKKSEEGS